MGDTTDLQIHKIYYLLSRSFNKSLKSFEIVHLVRCEIGEPVHSYIKPFTQSNVLIMNLYLGMREQLSFYLVIYHIRTVRTRNKKKNNQIQTIHERTL